MRNNPWKATFFTLAGIAIATTLIYHMPPVHNRLAWRIDLTLTYLRGVIDPVKPMPTPLSQPTLELVSSPTPTVEKTPLPTSPGPTPTLTPSPTPIPGFASLAAPAWEKQDPNNCGPATLSMDLRFYGWQGNQSDIADLLKPKSEDRNVNVEELIYYVRTRAGWLNAEFRVGGDLEMLKHLLAAGLPVMIEESFYFDEPYWPNDDLWAAHYLLLTGYDDATQTFTGQDSFHGADQKIPYETLDEYWKVFNRVYIIIYLPSEEETVKAILDPQWDVDANRQHALEISQTETQVNPDDAFAWFNLGTNLVYFERYAEAARAYDQARNLGLPQRMLRYQFGPFLAYFHSFRTDDLLALTEYALGRTPTSEEAMLWRGWGLYQKGDRIGARKEFEGALQANPNYQDANYAINFLSGTP